MASPITTSPSSSGRRSSDSNSPEFEFWMVRNPSSFPQPNLLSADELFVDGVLLPLSLLHLHHSNDPPDDHPNPQPPQNPETTTPKSDLPPDPEPESEPGLLYPQPGSSAPALTASKRWKDIFKRSDGNGNKEKEKKGERKRGGGSSSAELNINLWPFSRSRSAGNSGNRPRSAATATRKVSSAPCSRSNSAGESKSRKWPSSPGRGGVHLGRTSPVWQVRRGGSTRRVSQPAVSQNTEKGFQKEGNEARRKKIAAAGGSGTKTRVLSLNVPRCIGYRQHLSCRNDQSRAVTVAAVDGGDGVGQSGGGGSGDSERGGNLFNLRNLFTKKVY